MVGDSLFPRNLAMAGAAFLGDVRWFGLVGKMATDTGCQRIVGDGIDLGKTRGAAGVITVAEGAIAALAWGRQRIFGRSLGVCRSRPVTDLAAHASVASITVGLKDIRVAEATRFTPGVSDRLCFNDLKRSCPVVTPLPESLRHKRVSSHDQPDNECTKHHQ
jgi:hypothetical protein